MPASGEVMPPSSLDRIAERLAGALIALDFDGTLADLVRDPSTSQLVPGAADVLTALTEAGARIAVVTGRDAETALQLSQLGHLENLVISGLHGAELWRAGKLDTMAEPGGIASLRASLPPLLSAVDDNVWLEDKRLSLVVHTRKAADPDQALLTLKPVVSKLAEHAGLQAHPGHLVLEIRLPGLSKADALAQLLSAEPTAALYAGDDFGDLPAVQELQRWHLSTARPTFSVAVGNLAALTDVTDVRVDSPAGLITLLRQLL